MPKSSRKTKSKDIHFPNHKCTCNTCIRKQEAITLANGNGRTALAPIPTDENEIIEADAPIVAGKKHVRQRGVIRQHIAEWAMIRATEPDLTNKEIALRLGIGRQHLQHILARATQEGWLKFTDPISRMDYEIIPKVIDNISAFLSQKDKSVTIATAQGTIFKTYQEAKGVSDTTKTMLALKIETSPNEHGDVKVIAGQVVGKAREGED